MNTPDNHPVPRSTKPSDLRPALERHFGFRAFLEGQEDALHSVLSGGDALVIMPTGSGKSLCYQLAAMLLEGVTVVVSPLIALMKDQVDSLAAKGLPATFINSSLSPDEMNGRLHDLAKGRYRMVYVAPERFRQARFCEALAGLRVPLLAIDEAHCISQWGHDFRPDYLRLGKLVSEWSGARVMALTATATPDVRADIVRQLGLGQNGRAEPRVLVLGFARPNLKLSVTAASDHAKKLSRVREAVRNYKSGIIYCATRRQTESVAEELRAGGTACLFYHAGLEDDERTRIQEEFMRGRAQVVAATNAFGMGIDRSDIRFVLHWDIPGSVEAYYQEIGRAGRDGEEAHCELLFNYADVRTQEFFIQGANPTRQEILEVWAVVQRACREKAVTRPISVWAEEVPLVRNDMAVGTALAILERAGLIQREIEPGTRAYATALVPGAGLAALEEEFLRLAEKRRRDERKLKELLRYVETPICRHTYILRYFGERLEETRCRTCDNCGRSEAIARRALGEEEWIVVQKVLSCVARMNGRFGRGRVAQVLIGSRQQPLLEAGLDRLPTYGLLKEHSEAFVRDVIDELVREGSITVEGGDYPTLSLSERGRLVMWRKAPVELAWPEVREKKAAGRSRKSRLQVRESGPGVDPELFEALRRWRLGAAKERKVPAYAICHDRALQEISAVKPRSLADLEMIPGLGPSKIAQFGDDILELVDARLGGGHTANPDHGPDAISQRPST